MERLNFSSLWQNDKWSDVTLVIKPRRCQNDVSGAGVGLSASTHASPEHERRVTRSMLKGSPAAPGRQQTKAGPSSSTSPAAQPSRRRRPPERSPAAESVTPAAAGTPRNAHGALGKATRASLGPLVADAQPVTPAQQPACAAKDAAPAAELPHGSVVFPAHVAVLIATSEYFRRYFDAWHPQDGGKVIAIEVEPEEVEAAKMMLRYMYTGTLPSEGMDPALLLRMIKLADQFSVNRFLVTCNSALAEVPLEALSLEHVTAILELPPFLMEGGGPLALARRRAEAKLAAVFGDLEGAWFDPGRRQEFLRLPLPAVKFLLGRSETAVYNENTVLVALTDWIVANSISNHNHDSNGIAHARTDRSGGADDGAAPGGSGGGGGGGGTFDSGDAAAKAFVTHPSRSPVATAPRSGGGGGGVAATVGHDHGGSAAGLTDSQLNELFGLIRLPYLSAAYMSLIPHIGWVGRRLSPQLLTRVLQLVKAGAGAAPPGGPGGAGLGAGGGSGGGGGGGGGGDGRSQLLGGLYGNGALELLQRLTGSLGVPRAVPERTALELEWTISRSDVQALIAECRAEECGGGAGSGRGGGGCAGCGAAASDLGSEACGEGDEGLPAVESTRLFSEPPYYYAGFYWRMCFFVQKKVEPKRRRLADMRDVSGGGGGGAAAMGGGGGQDGGGGQGGGADVAAGDLGGGSQRGGGAGGSRDGGGGGCVAVYHDFLGVTCRAVLGGEEFAPLTCMNLELQAARFSALGERLPAQRAEVPGYVDDEVPYGVYDFFRQENLADARQLSPFVCRRDMLHLSCKITRCS